MNQRILIPLTSVAILLVVVVVGSVTRAEPVPVEVVVPAAAERMKEKDRTAEVDAVRDRSFAQRDAQSIAARDAATRDTAAFSREQIEETLAQQESVPEVQAEVVVAEEDVIEDTPARVEESEETKQEKLEDFRTFARKNEARTTRERTVETPNGQATVPAITQVTFTVVGGGTYTASVPVGATVQGAMDVAGVPYTTKGFGGMGAYVTSVDGIVEDEQAGMYWILYIDGAPAGLGISSAQVGSHMTWRLEKGW